MTEEYTKERNNMKISDEDAQRVTGGLGEPFLGQKSETDSVDELIFHAAIAKPRPGNLSIAKPRPGNLST